ncbi:MAG: SPOR domain-containing protein [Myxococcales bacterium]
MRDSHRMHDGIDLHLDNRQIAAFVIASLVVAGAVFSVGVLVGKNLAVAAVGPAKPGDALAAIDEKEKVRTGDAVTGTGGDPAAKPADPKLNFQAELTKPSTASPAIEPTKATAKAEEKAEPKKEEAKKEEPAKKDEVAKKDEPAKKEEAAAKKEEPAKKKESLSAAFDKAAKADDEEAASGFTLQVASLPSKEEADKLVDRLSAKGLKPYIVEADVPGKGHVFRVRSGNYTSKEDAESGLKAFKKKSALPAIIANK